MQKRWLPVRLGRTALCGGNAAKRGKQFLLPTFDWRTELENDSCSSVNDVIECLAFGGKLSLASSHVLPRRL